MRVWGGSKGWKTIGVELTFKGEVHSIASYDKGNGLAIGGTYTSLVLNGVQHNISYLVVLMVK